MMVRKGQLILTAFLLLPALVSAAVIRVPADQPNIQAGIDAASHGDTVLVADGTYTGTGNWDIDFHGKRITVISENGAEHCVINGRNSIYRGFYFHSGEGRNSVVEGFTIQNCNGVSSGLGGGIYCKNYSSPTIMKNIIINNRAAEGGGIACEASLPLITNNLIIGNSASYTRGGGIYCLAHSHPTITNNLIIGNKAVAGGGIDCYDSNATITNNMIIANTASLYGGGICANPNDNLKITNNLIAGNTAERDGGGIYFTRGEPAVFTNNTITGNTAEKDGGGIYCNLSDPPIANSILWNNTPDEIYVGGGSLPSVTYSDVQGGFWGHGNIDADPLFVAGPQGDHYLSQLAAGQPEQSPCVDTGDPAGEMIEGTTRTDWVQDAGVVDMGYHYTNTVLIGSGLVVGPGPAHQNPPRTRVFPPAQGADYFVEFNAYGPQHFGVNVACGDVDGDEHDEIITGPGPGAMYGPHVRGFDVLGQPVQGLNFIAYGTRKRGVLVSSGDLDSNGADEIMTGAGPGFVFGPHVRAFRYDKTAQTVTPVPGVSFMAYNSRHWGVNVTAGDIDGDGYDEIITGPGPGLIFGPHVRGWDVDGAHAQAMPVSYFAYSLRGYGVVVGCGDVDGDGFDEIITAPGPGEDFFANVRGWNYDNTFISPLPGCSFVPWQSTPPKYGARIFAGTDLKNDHVSEIVVGVGPDPAPSARSQVKVYEYDGSGVLELFSLMAFPSTWTHGVNVAAGRF